MTNIILSIIYLLITFTLTYFCYKKTGKMGLYLWICISIIISNIQTIKISDFFGFTTSLGNISYGSIFLATDILSEKYGEKAAKGATQLSFIIMIIFSLLMTIFIQFEPSFSDTSNEALKLVFNYMPRVTIGSLTAYYISQRVDAKLYQLLKNKYNKIWISNNVSTLVSQLLDTIIFTTITFAFVMPINEIISIGITMYLFKSAIAILDTPFMYLVNKVKTVNELN